MGFSTVVRGRPAALIVTVLTSVVPSVWSAYISQRVPEPYLDEVFHVRQALVYCTGQFAVWDPKITTPAGLYLLSYPVAKLTGCNPQSLRYLNPSLLIFLFSRLMFGKAIDITHSHQAIKENESPYHGSIQVWLKYFNIMTFPPLFFFSALFYTDVASTVFVFLCFQLFLDSQVSSSVTSWPLAQILLGACALLFRQTNIFWVAIFPAGLAIIQGAAACSKTRPFQQNDYQSFRQIMQNAWVNSAIYDPPLTAAWLEDYIKTGISLLIVTLLNVRKILPTLIPFITLIFTFAAFILWNGSVVLGDKSNHIATLHIPQILYLWPYILFFSWPLTLPIILSAMRRFWMKPSSPLLLLRQAVILAIWTSLALIAVHYNTIIHPFTLADNRHYTFYIFKILRHYPVLKYLATPLYIICAWLVIYTLSTLTIEHSPSPSPKESSVQSINSQTKIPTADNSTLAWVSPLGCRVSFVIVWLATTTLSLVSAPLVEPRYFILPWLFWRLHVPSVQTSESDGDSPPDTESDAAKRITRKDWLWRVICGEDVRLLMETSWFAVVNLVTGYLFLYKGFEWASEPGKVQRFMW